MGLPRNLGNLSQGITYSNGSIGINVGSPSSLARLAVANDGAAIAIKGVTASSSVALTVIQANDTQGFGLYSYGPSYTGGSIYGMGASSTALVQIANAPLGIGTFEVNQPLVFGTNSIERGRFAGSGEFLIGTTSSVGFAKFTLRHVDGENNGMASVTTTTGFKTHIALHNPNGEVGYISTNGTATSYSTSSDYRLKENVAPMTGALAKVQALNPVTYDWISNGASGQGFIAHELQAVIPDAVTGVKDAVDAEGKPIYQAVDTSYVVATLTAAIKELKAEVDALKAALSS